MVNDSWLSCEFNCNSDLDLKMMKGCYLIRRASGYHYVGINTHKIQKNVLNVIMFQSQDQNKYLYNIFWDFKNFHFRLVRQG